MLLANSAHEVRTPLNAIINYLEIALEGALDQETRENLAKSHSASKSLIYVINDLLDLTKAEEGQDLIKDEVFDLPATIRDATGSFKGDAKRKGLEYGVVEHPGLPRLVHGDQRRVRQAIANITANAIQHTSTGWVHVETWLQDQADNRVIVEIVVQDTGCGMSDEKLDALFRDLEQVTSDEDSLFKESETEKRILNGEKPKRTLGLGLAMVSRIVRNMDGQLRLKSEQNKGSRFVIQLPFTIPTEETPKTEASSVISNVNSVPSVATPPPALEDGEVTLIEKPSHSLRAEGVLRRRSLEEFASLHSYKSGSSNKSNTSKKSDVDRLIDAISGPFAVGEPESEERSLQRSNSKGSGRSHASSHSQSNSVRVSFSADRPGRLRRAKSYNAPEHLRSPVEGPAGSEFVRDSKTLLKAIRMPDEYFDEKYEPISDGSSRVLFDLPETQPETESDPLTQGHAPEARKLDAQHLQVLVAEDDPVNSKIIIKRLEKIGHKVFHTVNGEDCASAYGEKRAFFDVVLMDMQVSTIWCTSVSLVLIRCRCQSLMVFLPQR